MPADCPRHAALHPGPFRAVIPRRDRRRRRHRRAIIVVKRASVCITRERILGSHLLGIVKQVRRDLALRLAKHGGDEIGRGVGDGLLVEEVFLLLARPPRGAAEEDGSDHGDETGYAEGRRRCRSRDGGAEGVPRGRIRSHRRRLVCSSNSAPVALLLVVLFFAFGRFRGVVRQRFPPRGIAPRVAGGYAVVISARPVQAGGIARARARIVVVGLRPRVALRLHPGGILELHTEPEQLPYERPLVGRRVHLARSAPIESVVHDGQAVPEQFRARPPRTSPRGEHG
mmetsp:Transcript_56180/g.168174  ORF Transcript_56180/g.168174 Transcript_56180/m.168174 type:complete len:285 (-) Transcript_56180:760-1614(-)